VQLARRGGVLSSGGVRTGRAVAAAAGTEPREGRSVVVRCVNAVGRSTKIRGESSVTVRRGSRIEGIMETGEKVVCQDNIRNHSLNLLVLVS
jgi:hypothetical protein